jgi:ribonuclease HI
LEVIVRQNKAFPMMCKRCILEVNNRAVTEALPLLSAGMVVWVSCQRDSNYVTHGITSWIHKWKRNGWKNAKKGRMTNATLWRELGTAIARQVIAEFRWVKAHSGILLDECVDQLAIRAVMGNSCGPEFTVSPEDIENEDEHVMAEEEVTQWEG